MPSDIRLNELLKQQDIGLPYDSKHAAVDVSAINSFLCHGVEQPLLPADRSLLLKAAENTDKYMPYRVHAPSAQRIRALFEGQDPNVLLTNVGFRNLVAARYLSYNAEFLLSGEQQFAPDLQSLQAYIEKEPKRPKEYFLNHGIYGNNRNRFLDRVPEVWKRSFWPSEMGRDFMAVWRALAKGVVKGNDRKKYKIPLVGHLLSLQICGMY